MVIIGFCWERGEFLRRQQQHNTPSVLMDYVDWEAIGLDLEANGLLEFRPCGGGYEVYCERGRASELIDYIDTPLLRLANG